MPRTPTPSAKLNDRSKRLYEHEDEEFKVSSKRESPVNSGLGNLVDAARILESTDAPKVTKKTKSRVKQTQKKRTQSGKNVKPAKVKDKNSSDESSDSNSGSGSDREDEIASIKRTMTVMMEKLEKLESAKRKRKKNKKKCDKEVEVKKKISKKDSDKDLKTKATNENTTGTLPSDYGVHNNMQFLQQMVLMQQQIGIMNSMYPSFMVPSLGMVQPGLNATSTSFTNQILPSSFSTTKSTGSDKSNESSEANCEKNVKFDMSHTESSVKTKDKEKKGKSESSRDGYETDASEVYEPTTASEVYEPTSAFEKYLSAGDTQPSKSFLGFIDEMNKEENKSIQSRVVSSTKKNRNTTKDKEKTEEQKGKLERNKSMIENVQPTSDLAEILINLIPQKKPNPSKIETEEAERPVINNTLKALFGHQAIENKVLSKSFENTKQPKSPVDTSNRPSETKRYIDNSAWLRDCSHNFQLQDQDGDTILHILIAKEEEDKAIDVIKRMRGYRLDILNALGQTPLHLAMYTQSIKVIETLLQHGADISIVDAHGNSPIHIACEENSLEMLTVLFDSHHMMLKREKYTELMQIRNNQGMVAIHLATNQENKNILHFLVRKGVDLNIQESRSGNTPLLMVLAKGNWEFAKFLMESGANVNIPNFSNCYPLHLAVQGSSMEMVKLLLGYGAETGNKANEYDHASDSNEIKSLLAKEMRKRRRHKQKE